MIVRLSVIETIRTYTLLETPIRRLEQWLSPGRPGWRITRDQGTGSLRATLSGDHTILGGLVISANRDTDNIAARYVVAAEGNLPVMLHGKAAKHLTMRSEHLPAAIDVYTDALHRAVPLLGDVFSSHGLARVDASVTWRHDRPEQAARALSQARAHLTAQRSGRRVISAHGVQTTTLRHTRQHLVRAYDKTAESIAAARGSATTPDLGDGTLVRLEVEHTRQTARRLYGKDLTALSRIGADMARHAVETTAEPFARVLADLPTTTDQVARLIAAGADPSRACALIGPSLLLAEGGIPALTSTGVSIGTAYRWRAELRALTGQAPDAMDEAADDIAEREDQDHQDLWAVDDAVYFDGDDS